MPEVSIRIDTQALSHDLLPGFSAVPAGVLRPGVHDLTVGSGSGYGFVSGAGINVDLSFDVSADGAVVVDPRFAGFAEGRGGTLILHGCPVVLDTRSLSHALWPQLLGYTGHLGPGRHDLTVVPAANYGFIVASGLNATFGLTVNTAGDVVVDPRFRSFARADGRTLVLEGHRVTIDGRGLTFDLELHTLDVHLQLTRDRAHQITLVPAPNWVLRGAGPPFTELSFALNTDGTMRPAEIPDSASS